MALKTFLSTFKSKSGSGGFAVLPRIDRYLIQKDAHERLNSDRAKGCIHPSQIHLCTRTQIYDIIGAPQNTEGGDSIQPKTARIFGNGHSMHDRWQRYFKEMGLTEITIPGTNIVIQGIEVKLRSVADNVTGSADGIIDLNGILHVLELKSMNDMQFTALKKPKPEHVKQVHLYMHIFNLDRAVILYENKNNQECKEFLVMREEKIIKELQDRCRLINKALATKTLPEREMCKTPNDPAGRYCPYTKICFADKKFSDVLDEKLWDTIEANLPPSLRGLVGKKSLLSKAEVPKPSSKKVIHFKVVKR